MHDASGAGLTRASKKAFEKKMDCRVKPGNDEAAWSNAMHN
jgi:hypothetical protein